MFRVKICGITTTRDAIAVAEAGADAVGLNFFPKSARFIDRDAAKAIVDVLPRNVKRIGLFVNENPSRVRELFHDLDLDAVQLHGDESLEYLAEMNELPLIRALRLSEEGIGLIHETLRLLEQRNVSLEAVLVDSFQKGQYGGTGKTANWAEAARYHSLALEGSMPPLILAGGLTPDNVASAIRAVTPFGVDTAGGVELSPGVKSVEQVRAFVDNAKVALRAIQTGEAAD